MPLDLSNMSWATKQRDGVARVWVLISLLLQAAAWCRILVCCQIFHYALRSWEATHVHIGLNRNTRMLELQNVPDSSELEHSVLEETSKKKKKRKGLSSPGPELFIWLVKEEPSGTRVAKTWHALCPPLLSAEGSFLLRIWSEETKHNQVFL